MAKQNSYLDCSGTHLLHFPKLQKILFPVGLILKNNNIEHIPLGEGLKELSRMFGQLISLETT